MKLELPRNHFCRTVQQLSLHQRRGAAGTMQSDDQADGHQQHERWQQCQPALDPQVLQQRMAFHPGSVMSSKMVL